MKEYSDSREIIIDILKEKDSTRQRMLFGFYKNKLSSDQILFLKQKLIPPSLLQAKEIMGGKILDWMD